MRNFLRQFFFEKQSFLLPTVCKTPPLHIQIEPTNICNLKCPLCVTTKIPEEQKKHLSFDEFKFILGKFNYPIRIYLTKFGEPFINPDIFHIIEHAKSKGHHLCISSNFDIEPSLIEKIVDSRLDDLIISLDGFSQKSNQTYRIGANFENIVNNMLKIHQIKKEKGVSHPKITWQYLVNKFNESETDAAKAFAKKHGIHILFETFGLGEDQIEYNFGVLERLKERWLPKDKNKIRDFLVDKTSPRIADGNCLFLWRSISINADMKVTPCCHTYTKSSYFGDLKESSVEDIWNNETFQSARRLFNHDKNGKGNVRTICHACPNFSKTKTRLQHFKDQIRFLKEGLFKRMS